MTEAEITSILQGTPSWGKATSSERHAFVSEMVGRQYGHGALTSAWAWFMSGWRAKPVNSPARSAITTTDDDGRPLIGTPLGRKYIGFDGIIGRSGTRIGKLVGWNDNARTQPILEYPDGTFEALFSLTETNWKSA